MAKRGRRQRDASSPSLQPRSYPTYNPNPNAVLPSTSGLSDLAALRHTGLDQVPVRSTPWQEYEDRRRYHPEGRYRPPAAAIRDARRLIAGPAHTIGFKQPNRVLLCQRRHQRREVLHALQRTGKGSRARTRRRSYWSDVSCKG